VTLLAPLLFATLTTAADDRQATTTGVDTGRGAGLNFRGYALSGRDKSPAGSAAQTSLPPWPSKSDAELAGKRPHVQLSDVARVAALALLGVEDGAAVVGVDAEANAQVARVELCKGEGVKAGGRRRQEVYDTSISSVFLRCFDEG